MTNLLILLTCLSFLSHGQLCPPELEQTSVLSQASYSCAAQPSGLVLTNILVSGAQIFTSDAHGTAYNYSTLISWTSNLSVVWSQSYTMGFWPDSLDINPSKTKLIGLLTKSGQAFISLFNTTDGSLILSSGLATPTQYGIKFINDSLAMAVGTDTKGRPEFSWNTVFISNLSIANYSTGRYYNSYSV